MTPKPVLDEASKRNLDNQYIHLHRYHVAFLVAWLDADPDIPILKQAKAEYARLKWSAANHP